MRVLILGGTAFTGPHLVRELHGAGHEVAVFHRGRSDGALPEGVRRFLGENAALGDHAAELQGFSPEIVVHMMALSAQDAWNALTVFRGVARRMIVISSQDVYRAYGRLIDLEPGDPDPVPLPENAPLRERLYPYRERVSGPDHPLYHYDKILVERIFQSEPELPATILRYPMVYGPGDRQHRFFPQLKRMDDGRPAILVDAEIAGWRWTKGYCEDMAHGVFLAATAELASGRVYNLGEEDPPAQAAWIEQIGRAAGWSGRVAVLPSQRMPESLANDMKTTQDFHVYTARIRRELGYQEQVIPAEALRRTIEWERSHPPDSVDPKEYDYGAEDAALAAAAED